MITALYWIVSSLVKRRARRTRELILGRAVVAWKRERYDLNPAFNRVRIPRVTSTRIPTVRR